MTMVKVKCKEGRLVAHERYQAGREYLMEAERAGKYHESFTGVGKDDDEIIAREWGARKAIEAKREESYRVLNNYDPSILAAAAKLIQNEAGKRLAMAGKESVSA